MKRLFATIVGSFVLIEAISVCADPPKLTEAQIKEMRAIIDNVNHPTLAYKAAVMQRMLAEANYFSERLKLPMPRPIEMKDVVYPHVSSPWFSVINETNPPYLPATTYGTNIYNPDIPREQRLHALTFAVRGVFETTNFFFSFLDGKLCDIERLSEHGVEYYAHDLDKLVGKPSLIDTNGAYQLATQWLAAADVNMAALKKLKWTVSQLHYLLRGATNTVTLPLYYVDFGNKHYPAQKNLHAFDEPLLSVEVLGTTKELQDLRLQDIYLSRRPPMLITNALDLIRVLNPPEKQFQHAPEISQTNSLNLTNAP